MAIVTRASKGSELTHAELDNNFNELEDRIAGKANASHTHNISSITGLSDALNAKVDSDDANVPNGYVQLNPSGKIPCELLDDCFDVGSKVSSSFLFDDGLIKPELLPPYDCDCGLKQNRLRNYRIVSGAVMALSDDDILILDDNSIVNISSLSVGQLLKIRRVTDSVTVAFTEDIRFLDETNGTNWTTGTGINSLELINTTGQWYQIG